MVKTGFFRLSCVGTGRFFIRVWRLNHNMSLRVIVFTMEVPFDTQDNVQSTCFLLYTENLQGNQDCVQFSSGRAALLLLDFSCEKAWE